MLRRADSPLLSQRPGRSRGHLPTFRAPRRAQSRGVTGIPGPAAVGMRAELQSRRHRSAVRARAELGQRRCRGAVPSVGPIVTRAGERALDSTAPAALLPHGSPPCPAPCAPQGCAVRALGLTSHRPTVGHSCKLAPQIALGSKVASDRGAVPLAGPAHLQGYVPAASQRCRGVTEAFPTESSCLQSRGYPRFVLCSSSVDKSEVSFLN